MAGVCVCVMVIKMIFLFPFFVFFDEDIFVFWLEGHKLREDNLSNRKIIF